MASKTTEKVNDLSDDKKSCFIITPIGAIDSEVFKKTKGLISSVIDPVLNEFDFKAVPAYEINNSGSITRQILKSIVNDKLVIANLTNLNPNVMYELAVRHAIRLPVIIMAEHGTNLPFDITDQRTIFYYDTLLGSEEAKPKLRLAIESALKDESVDNPIYQVVEEATIIKGDKSEQSINEYLIRRLDQLENNISAIKQKPIEVRPESRVDKSIEIQFHDRSLVNDEKRKIISGVIKNKFSGYQISYGETVKISNISSSVDTFREVLTDFINLKKIMVIHWQGI